MARGVTGRNRRSIWGRLLVSYTDDQIETAKLLTAWFCSVDISVLQLNKNRLICLYCRRMRNYSPVDTSARWWVRPPDSDKLGSQPAGQPAFLPVARRETRLPVWFVRQAYGLPFCLASIKNIKLKQCTLVKPSHSAIIACHWETTPSDVFQTAVNLILSLVLPQRYHAALSKYLIQTFQTHSCTRLLGFLGTCLEALGYDMVKLFSPEINGRLPERERLQCYILWKTML